MIADFATQMVDPPRVRCLGVVVKPFCIGHLLILRAMENRFASSEFPAYEDLISAAFVCAHSWEENQKLLRARLRRWLFLKVWGLLAGKFNVAQETIQLFAYIQKCVEIPETKKSSGSVVRYLFSDWETRVLSHLKSIGYTESEALNMPIGKANFLFVSHLEESGKMEFQSKRDTAVRGVMNSIVEKMEQEDAA